jgi:hypothetical protein
MNYIKKTFKHLMLANLLWLICGIAMTSSIFFSGGYIDVHPTFLNVSLAAICDCMFVFSTLLARKNGELFKELFGY